MKREYLQSLPKLTDIRNQAYNAHLTTAQQLFHKLQANYDQYTAESLFDELKTLNSVRPIKKADKKPLYEYFLKRELAAFDHVRGKLSVPFSIMKLTKCKIENFKLDWKQFFESLTERIPEIGGSNLKSKKELDAFVKHVKLFFDHNNAMEVLKYFEQRSFKDLYKVIILFVRISPDTSQQIFDEFVQALILRCRIQILSKTDFLSLIFWLQKNRKHISFSKEVYEFINELVLQYILAADNKNGKKNSFENNFNSTSAEVLQKTLGKSNPNSIQLLQIIFSFLKKFIKPLENSTKSVMFIYWLVKSIFQRFQTQKRTKERLKLLIQKINSKKEKEKEEEPETKEESQVTVPDKPEDKQEKPENEEEEEEEENQEQDEENEEEDFQGHYNQGTNISFEKEEQQKGDTDEQKRQKMEKLLANELTSEIITCLQTQIEQLFDILYFVNSKKTISHLLRYIYRLFPHLAIRSLETLNKAANIPNINEDGLVRNLTVTVEHMFMAENYQDGVRNVMRVLEKAFNSRRIVDVWNIYESVSSKIPMLDDQDLEKVSDNDKQEFEKKFQMNHDRFYDEYSGHMLEAFKKLLYEAQYFEQDQHWEYFNTMNQFYRNSYPGMRKKIMEEVMEALSENPNALSLIYFRSAELPTRQYEILKAQFSLINEQNKDSEQLRLSYLGILCKNMKLAELKPHIRKMAKKGHYNELIDDYHTNKATEDIKWLPLGSTLNYLWEDPKFNYEFEIPVQQIKASLKEMEQYRDELIAEAGALIDTMKEDDNQSVPLRVVNSYIKPANISTLTQRKELCEILEIVNSINSKLVQKIISIKSNKKKLQLVPSEVSPYICLSPTDPLHNKLKKLVNIQEVLHDPKLVSVLKRLFSSEYFIYADEATLKDVFIKQQRKKIRNHESPDCVNRILFGSEHISSAINFRSILLHKTSAGKNLHINGCSEELFILSMANASENYKKIRQMFRESGKLDEFRAMLFEVINKKIQNRQLIKRITSTIDFLSKSQGYRPFLDQQILDFVDYHATLTQSNDSKIKELAMKSFLKFTKIAEENPVSEVVSQGLLKYRSIDKMELIWLTYLASEITHLQFEENKELVKKKVEERLKQVQGLLLHQMRSVRRISLFIYPSLIRTLKKIGTTFETIPYESEEYSEKSLQDFIVTGYIRKEQQNIDLKDKVIHRKHPQPAYRVKKCAELPSDTFTFLLENPENALKFVKSYHSDLASTTEMMIAAMHNSVNTVDLLSIATKAIEKLIYIFKTKNLTISASEFLVGSKFFKYLCKEDAKSGFRFFHAIKQFVLSCLSNMESLDNQTLVILYSYNLLIAYESVFTEKIPEIEQFLTQIFSEIITKSSKAIYSKIQNIFFKKIKNYKAIEFLLELCEKMLTDSKKVYRAGYLLAIVSGKSYTNSEKLIRKMLDEKIELENQIYINSLLTYLLTCPIISACRKDEVLKTKILDLEKLISENKMSQFFGDYLKYSNHEFLAYLSKQINAMVNSESVDAVKTGFNILNSLIKNCSTLHIDKYSTEFVIQLLKIEMDILRDKMELQLDFDSSYKAISYLLGSELIAVPVFERYLTTVIENMQPTKKFADLLQQLLSSPINFLKLEQPCGLAFANKILDLQTNSALYKSVLKILSTFFRYNLQSFPKLYDQQKQNPNKTRYIILLQSYLLAENVKLNPTYVKEVLRFSTKDRKNMWAREMLLIRGQREYFDDEETYEVWREIKLLSNPYHYHA